MAYCVNLQCAEPQNSSESETCHSCGYSLRLNGKYAAIKEIGHGGFGRTFLAIDYSHPDKRRCVIKQLFPDSQNAQSYSKTLELFRQEAQQLKRLGEHPQIPDCFASFEENDQQFIIQEFVDGNNLNQQLTLNGLFTEAQLIKLLKEILPVLDFIHQKGVIHRDIKPANIICSQADDTLWLVDLGAAKQLTGTALAKTGTVIGSAEYTAPEQVRGKATFASDIYSLGVTCIYLLTGVSPFNLFDTGDSRWVWRDFLPKAISSELGCVLDKMIQMSTNKRYSNIQDIQADLESIFLRVGIDSGVDNVLTKSGKSSVLKKPLSSDQKAYTPDNKTVHNQPTESTILPQNRSKSANRDLKVDFSQSGDLTNVSAEDATFSLQPPRPKAFIPKTWPLLLGFSFLGILGMLFALQPNTTNEFLSAETSVTEELSPEILEPTENIQLPDSLYTSSADWQIYTDLVYRAGKIYVDGSKIGVAVPKFQTDQLTLATWNLEDSRSPDVKLTPLSDSKLKIIGTVGDYFNKVPLIVDQDKRLKTLNTLTGESQLIPDQEKFSIDKLGLDQQNANRRHFIFIDPTKSFIYDYSFKNDGGKSSFKVWDIKTGEILTSQTKASAYSEKGYWPSLPLSHYRIQPFSLDGRWLIVFNGSRKNYELWDLASKKRVRTFKADAVFFSHNPNILIVEEQTLPGALEHPDNNVSQLKLFSLNTQEYVFQSSSNIKRIALHPHEEIIATFDGNSVSVGSIAKPSERRDMELEVYPDINLQDYYEPLQSLQFSPNGKVLAGIFGRYDRRILIFWDVTTGKLLGEPQPIDEPQIDSMFEDSEFPTLQFSPDSQKLIIVTRDSSSLSEENINIINIWKVPAPSKQ